MKNYKIDKPKNNRSKILLIIFTIILILIIAGGLVVKQKYFDSLRPVSASQKAIVITIPKGATVHEIALKLESEGLIKSAWAFGIFVRFHDVRDRLQAGTYNLRPNQSVASIVENLTQGKIATDIITILPGKRLDQIKSALISNAGFSEKEVDKALNPALYKDHPALANLPSGASLEGYIYPDSYQKTANTNVETIIRLSLDELQKNLTDEFKSKIAKQGLSLHEAITMASIVSQEVSNVNDKPIVAQVFLLRKKIGMMLGSDVTAFYGAQIAGQEPTVFYDSPYNTRKYKGMPPGPISNFTSADLNAIANPSNTEYLFFVAGDDGNTYFSFNNAQHEALTRQHCLKLCQ